MGHCPKLVAQARRSGPCALGSVSLASCGRELVSELWWPVKYDCCLDGDALFQHGPHSCDQGQAAKLLSVWLKGN